MATRPDELNAPQFGELPGAARRILEERFARDVATPRWRLAVVAVHELRGGASLGPIAAFRAAVRTVSLSTVEFYVGVVDTLVDEPDRDVADSGRETTH